GDVKAVGRVSGRFDAVQAARDIAQRSVVALGGPGEGGDRGRVGGDGKVGDRRRRGTDEDALNPDVIKVLHARGGGAARRAVHDLDQGLTELLPVANRCVSVAAERQV